MPNFPLKSTRKKLTANIPRTADPIESIFIKPTSTSEIQNIINRYKNQESCDIFGLSMNMIKLSGPFIVKPLEHIFNLSLTTGVFPMNMKIAKVLPLFKGGNSNDCTNYRPISLLPQFSKLLEKLFDKRLQDYLTRFSIINQSQYGFQPGRNTTQAIIDLVNTISDNIDNEKFTIGVFVDLKKAFDSLDHNHLLRKLMGYGIRGIAHSWIKSFLTNRKQIVSIDNFNSNVTDICYGVPQGSVLGPKLFLLYINDMFETINRSKLIVFADDTNALFSGKTPQDALNIANSEMKSLYSWFLHNKLSMNSEKN